MLLPTVTERRFVRDRLAEYFRWHRERDFLHAIRAFCRVYSLPRPKVVWFEYMDHYKTAGRTFVHGEIHLIHPERWKNGRKQHTEGEWVETVLHELGHYLCWSWPEKTADKFAECWVEGC